MTRRFVPLLALLLGVTWMAAWATSQPPDGFGKSKGGKFPGDAKGPGGPPPFQMGRVLPPPLRQQLNLSPEQERALEALEQEVRQRLNELLTEEQKRIVQKFPRPGAANPADEKPTQPRSPRPASQGQEFGPRLIVGDPLRLATTSATLTGDAAYGDFGDLQREHAGHGIRLLSGAAAPDRAAAGSASWTVSGVEADKGRWFRLRIRGLAQESFRVEKDDLFLRIEFLKDQGRNSLDSIKRTIYEKVEADRARLSDPGVNRSFGTATWRNYVVEFRTPFREVDTLRLSVGFAHGTGKGSRSEFWVNEVEITPIADPADFTPRTTGVDREPPALQTLIALGGRWYYDPRGGSKDVPKRFDHTNADRLLYRAGRLEAPFAGNTTAWLRKGYLDLDGKLVESDRLVTDNVVVSFTDTHLVLQSHNLPNHPTAIFPDRWRLVDGNPNYILEQRNTWYLPLEPKVNPRHVAMDAKNANNALPLGPIGVAVNGIVFLNPFDDGDQEALWRLDRCCGHPSPGQRYHYHKYPVCLNTPWADDGQAHSPLIGFALDGFPIFGPYEAAGELAKDSRPNPLNEFNLHRDEERGWHYHVTPGRFPHVLGGYWGHVDSRNLQAKKGPPGFKKKMP